MCANSKVLLLLYKYEFSKNKFCVISFNIKMNNLPTIKT